MEELIQLRQYIETKNYDKALEIVAELEEMSKEDKLNKIYSYCVILLIHLIKQEAEKRTTRSWDVSIRNSIREINRTKKRRSAVFASGNAASQAACLGEHSLAPDGDAGSHRYSTLAVGVTCGSRLCPMSDTALRRSAKSLRDVGANAPFKKRKKSGGYYVHPEELREIIVEAMPAEARSRFFGGT